MSDTATKERAERIRQLKEDYRAVFLGASTSKQGRRVLQDLLQWSGILSPSYVRGDTHETARMEGKKEVGHLLLNLLDKRTFDGLLSLESAGMDITSILDGGTE